MERTLKYAPWSELDPKYKFQAYDSDGWLIAYECRPWIDECSIEWRFSSGAFIILYDDPQDLKVDNWKETLIERQTDQDGPTEPDPCDLAHDHNAITYGADDPTEYDPS